jgi:hypothetical protein
MPERSDETRRKIRRTTTILVGVALLFFFGFIMMGVLRS